MNYIVNLHSQLHDEIHCEMYGELGSELCEENEVVISKNDKNPVNEFDYGCSLIGKHLFYRRCGFKFHHLCFIQFI